MPERTRLPDCPICGNSADPALRPFCSARCADIDLGRWLTGQYQLPDVEGDDAVGGEGSDRE
jgi:endogenous inhibitor of DNA gyrase (YacG/DUF329 family)